MEYEVRMALTKESCGFFADRDEAMAWIDAHGERRYYDLVPVGEYRRFNERAALLAAAARYSA